MKKSTSLPELTYLAELIGEFMEYWGFKSIHGRIWTNVFLSEVPLDAADLMARLSVSKALVSISIKDLLEYEVLMEQGLSPSGTRLYAANPNIQKIINQVLRQREKVMMGKVQAAFEQLKKTPKAELAREKIGAERIKDLDRFMKNGERALDTLISIL